MNKPFVVYCVQLNELMVIDNQYGLDCDLAMGILTLGLKKKYSLIFLGEL